MLRNLAARLAVAAGITIVLVIAVSSIYGAVYGKYGEFRAELPLGIASGAALGFLRMCMTERLFPLVLAARKGKMVVALLNQLLGLALVAGFLICCVRRSLWLFSGGAAGLMLVPVVIIWSRKTFFAGQ
jgi:hypothetical protein